MKTGMILDFAYLDGLFKGSPGVPAPSILAATKCNLKFENFPDA